MNTADEYGNSARLSYNSYLRVQDLIALQELKSNPAHHDELLFITIHQTYELWFKQILHEIDAASLFINGDKLIAASRAMLRAVEIEKILVNQIHVLETMTPIDFLGFRDELKPASGFQSMQFREIEFASGLKDERTVESFNDDEFASERLRKRFEAESLSDAFYRALTRDGFDAPLDAANEADAAKRENYGRRVGANVRLQTEYEHHYPMFQLAESLIAHDEQILLWRAHHVAMVERMLGTKPGTGGSAGVGYLQTTLKKKIYPEMWEARTLLGAEMDAADASDVSTSNDMELRGCPFA